MKCMRCGNESYDGRICHGCMRKFLDRRTVAFERVEKELGKLCAENHKEYVKLLKKYENEMKKQEMVT